MFLAYHSCEFVKVDVKGYVRVWNYDDALPVNSFENHKLSDRGLSKLLLINELDESLLLAATSMPLLPMYFLLYLYHWVI